MQYSHYLKVFPSEGNSDHLLLYSTKKASLISLKKATYKAVKDGKLTLAHEALLTKHGMLVEDQHNEKLRMLGFISERNATSTCLHMTVVLNLDCNFACRYCFEEEVKGKHYMSDATVNHLIHFIKEKFTEDKKSVVVDFYGGEPLLSIEHIKTISRAINCLTETRGASYRFMLVTNGSLFTRPVAEDLVPLGLESVKVTLDGPAEVHNKSRPFKSGAGSFNTIIHNITRTCNLVKIIIGGNFNKNTFAKFPALLDHLEKKGLAPDTLASVKFDPIMKNPQSSAAPFSCFEGCLSINEPWISKAEKLLREEILKRGYNTPKPRPMHCMIETLHSYVVNFDGVIYKCPGFIGKKDFAIGDVHKGIQDYTSIYKIGFWKNTECVECTYLPMCYGGCRYMAFIRDGHIDNIDCKKEYLDGSLERLIKQDLKYREKAGCNISNPDNSDVLMINDLFEQLGRVCAHHFPTQFKQFIPPSLERIIKSYNTIDNVIQTYIYGNSAATANNSSFVERAFMAVASIRYLDDFIDKALWPHIPKCNPEKLSRLFDTFLQKALDTARKFDPFMPETIIELPRLEMYLALNPGQENFDRFFKKLFIYKSYDMFYTYQIIHEDSLESINHTRLVRLALIDYIRDFSADHIATDTDLNLYKYIRDNNINPRKFIAYLMDCYRQEDPRGYRKAKKRGFIDSANDSRPADDENKKAATSLSFHESFPLLFNRAISLLQKLLPD